VLETVLGATSRASLAAFEPSFRVYEHESILLVFLEAPFQTMRGSMNLGLKLRGGFGQVTPVTLTPCREYQCVAFRARPIPFTSTS